MLAHVFGWLIIVTCNNVMKSSLTWYIVFVYLIIFPFLLVLEMSLSRWDIDLYNNYI